MRVSSEVGGGGGLGGEMAVDVGYREIGGCSKVLCWKIIACISYPSVSMYVHTLYQYLEIKR